jgi:hypothetical protein
MLMLPQDEILLYSPDSTHLFYAYGTFILEKVRGVVRSKRPRSPDLTRPFLPHQLFRARLLETHVLDPASTQLIFDVIRASADRLDSLTPAPNSVTALHATLLRSLLPPEGDPGRLGAGALHSALQNVRLPKGPPSPGPTDPLPPAASHQQAMGSQWAGPVPTPNQPQLSQEAPAGVVDFVSFSAGAADGTPWEGLDEEALAALATLESSLGTFNWEELTYSPP